MPCHSHFQSYDRYERPSLSLKDLKRKELDHLKIYYKEICKFIEGRLQRVEELINETNDVNTDNDRYSRKLCHLGRFLSDMSLLEEFKEKSKIAKCFCLWFDFHLLADKWNFEYGKSFLKEFFIFESEIINE